jgi:HAD superfamily hydrolase (TIGR01549 family)
MKFSDIPEYDVYLWDFDGVIKDSHMIKSDAYTDLFSNEPSHVIRKIRKHHLANGGMSRYEKIPLYLSFTKNQISRHTIELYLKKYSDLVMENVVKSNYIEGVIDLLKFNKSKGLKSILITATPEREIYTILNQLNICSLFSAVYGAPINKKDIVRKLIENSPLQSFVFIGDSNSDYQAAVQNNIDFILRSADYNNDLKSKVEYYVESFKR